MNRAAHEAGDMVKLIELEGEEKLFYPAFPIDIAVIRATYADERGNCTFEREGVYAEALAQAQAAHNSGGRVIVQVEKVVSYGCLDARLIRLPGIYVDALVVARPENHMQTFGTQYDPAFSGEIRTPSECSVPAADGCAEVIARRAAMELTPCAVTNLGIGMPEGVASVAAEEGLESMVLTTEVGAVGGVPAGGMDFGAATNVDCILEQPVQFDFYDGGGLDTAFLGLAQMDGDGNVNVSKFGPNRRMRRLHQHYTERQEGGLLRYLHRRRPGGLSRRRYAEAPPGGQGQKAGQAGGAGDLCGPLRNQA